MLNETNEPSRGSEHMDFTYLEFDLLPTDHWNAILRLRSEVFVVEQQCVYLDPDDEDQTAGHFYRWEKGQVIAYMRILRKDQWHLGRIIVAPDHRRKGIAKELVEKATLRCLEADKEKAVVMSSQVYLTDFYRSLGFEVKGRMYLEDGIPHVKMVLHDR